MPVTLTGTNFISGAAVFVNNAGIAVSGVTVVSATQIRATFSMGAAAGLGVSNVTVTTSEGTSGGIAFTVNSACPATTTLAVLMAYGNTGCQWGDKVFYGFDYSYTSADSNNNVLTTGDVPASAVTVTFSNAGSNPSNPAISLLADWSVADGSWAAPFLGFNVRAPAASPILATSVSITGQVSNVDPDHQPWSFIVDAGSVTGSTYVLPLNVDIEPPPDIASGTVTMTGTSSVSLDNQTQFEVIAGLLLISTGPPPSPALQQGNPASVSRIDLIVASTRPSIGGLSVSSGAVGGPVTITGTNFGASQGSSTVTFNGAAAAVSSWSDTSITVIVPTEATTGTLVVTVAGAPSSSTLFTVTAGPGISTLWPTSGPVGMAVTISGSGFGASQGTSKVTFNGAVSTATSWSDAIITLTVPAGATTGNVVVTVGGVDSNGILFTVTGLPIVTGVAPAIAAPGAPVTITGSGFGTVQGIGAVWLGTAYGTVVSWSDIQVVATVAANSATGTAKVLHGGVWSNGVAFTVNTVTVTDVAPTSGVPGTVVTFTGAFFGASQGTGKVQLGSTFVR